MDRLNPRDFFTMKISLLLSCASLVLLFGSSSFAADPFEVLNESFREQHAAAREREWANRGPVILVEFDKLTLLNGAERKSAEVIPPRYDRLKSIAHAPLVIYLLLMDLGDNALGSEREKQLKEIALRLKAVQATLDKADFRKETLKRQQEILQRSTDFIDEIMSWFNAIWKNRFGELTTKRWA